MNYVMIHISNFVSDLPVKKSITLFHCVSECPDATKWAQIINISYLVNQRRPLVQLDDAFAVLHATSALTKLYKWLNSDGLDEYLDSSLYKKKTILME